MQMLAEMSDRSIYLQADNIVRLAGSPAICVIGGLIIAYRLVLGWIAGIRRIRE